MLPFKKEKQEIIHFACKMLLTMKVATHENAMRFAPLPFAKDTGNDRVVYNGGYCLHFKLHEVDHFSVLRLKNMSFPS